MIWKEYSHLNGTHAFLSPSKHYWLNYSPDKLASSYQNHRKAVLGTQFHILAEMLINMAVRLPNTAATFNSFVNDAIGFKMTPEVTLYYSPNCYGTADAISYTNGVLRIHDLKTGTAPGSMNQLLVYAALFCLDYGVEPGELVEIHLRLYQSEDVLDYSPTPKEVFDVVKKIVDSDRIIKQIDAEGVL